MVQPKHLAHTSSLVHNKVHVSAYCKQHNPDNCITHNFHKSTKEIQSPMSASRLFVPCFNKQVDASLS